MPAVQAVLPVTDPNKVEEVYATEVIVNIRDNVAHVTFIAVRPSNVDANGNTAEERIVTARVVMSVTTATGFAECIGQVKTAAQMHQTQKPN
jgi:hypothetical protein